MARRRKHGREKEPPADSPPKAPPAPTTSLGALFKAAGVTAKPTSKAPRTLVPPGPESLAPATVPPRTGSKISRKVSAAAELRMLNDAYAGARPLARKTTRGEELAPGTRTVKPSTHQARIEVARSDDRAARARLAALVAGGVRWKQKRDDDYVEGLRSDASPKLIARLTAKSFTPDATLDLHGERSAQAADSIASFVRTNHKRGARQLLIIAGKGLHSEGGIGVLRDTTVDALTQGFAAPLVLAYATAHAHHGGSGALAVLLG